MLFKRKKNPRLPLQSELYLSEFDGGLHITLTRKAIKNIHLRVRPPQGTVTVSAPLHTPDSEIERFVLTKHDWINKHRAAIARRPQLAPPCYEDGENHRIFGQNYRLSVLAALGKGHISLHGTALLMHIAPNADTAARRKLLDNWLREQLSRQAAPLLEHWQNTMGLRAASWHIRAMKSRWGSCNIAARRIWLSLELARHPLPCLEYVIVHELAHLIERGHGKRFIAVMDTWLPDWRQRRATLRATGDDAGAY